MVNIGYRRMRRDLLATILLLAGMPLLWAQAPPFDLVITNGHILDGTGSPWYSGDVGIRGGKDCRDWKSQRPASGPHD